MVSPKALLKPSNTADRMPVLALLITTCLTVSHLVAPRTNDDSRASKGTALNTSSDTEIIMGNTMIARTTPAERTQ